MAAACPARAPRGPCREGLFRLYVAELAKGEEVLREREHKQREAERRLQTELRVAEQRRRQVREWFSAWLHWQGHASRCDRAMPRLGALPGPLHHSHPSSP